MVLFKEMYVLLIGTFELSQGILQSKIFLIESNKGTKVTPLHTSRTNPVVNISPSKIALYENY